MGVGEGVDRLILSPLSTLMDPISDQSGTDSIWPMRRIRGVPIVQCPQGRAAVDGIFSLPRGCEVVLLGICGGLRAPASRGTWVCVDRARNGRYTYYRSISPPSGVLCVDGCTVGSLTESWLATDSLASQAHVVDMETSHIYEVANRCAVKALSLLLVADEPPHRPFWDTDLQVVATQVTPVLDILADWLAGGTFEA